MPLISVIVPIYNVEKYLDRCVDSIINQTYKNLEIILVDDGSPDNCPQMCDDYAKKDSRIKVVHKENGGLSDARNVGMEDEFWTYQIFGKAKKVTRINKTMYYYFQRGSSIMGNGYNIKRLDALEGKMNRQAYIEKNFPTLATKAKVDLYGSCMFAYQSVLKFMSGNDKKKAGKIIKDYKNRCKLTNDEINSITDSSRKYYKLAKFNFYLCCKMRSMFNIGF